MVYAYRSPDSLLLRGVFIGSGATLGGNSIVTKNVSFHAILAYNLARIVKNGVFWLRPPIHMFTSDDTTHCAMADSSEFIYPPKEKEDWPNSVNSSTIQLFRG